MEFISELGLFILKAFVIVVAVATVFSLLVKGITRSRSTAHGKHGWIELQKINDLHDSFKDVFNQVQMGEQSFMKQKQADMKAKRKQEKKEQKSKKKQTTKEKSTDADEKTEGSDRKKKLYVLNFDGDLQASQVSALRNEITAVLVDATKDDEVLVGVQSPGGLVHAYGLAASQLLRVRQAGIKLTVAVDQVAASGGYLMATVADRIIAAPFALVGSIGVMAELPNFNRLLQKHQIDYEVLTAGEHKRTLTMFGENTEAGRSKFMEEIEDVHQLFREFVTENRPSVEDEKVKTGEAWYGQRAIELNLIDEILTSDQYILDACKERDVYSLKWVVHQTPIDKLTGKLNALVSKIRHPFGLDSARNPLENIH